MNPIVNMPEVAVEEERKEPGAGGDRDPLAELRARLDAALDELRPKIRKAFEELDSKVDEAMADISPRVRTAVHEGGAKVNEFVADMQPRLDSLLQRLQVRIDEMRQDLEDRATRSSQGRPVGEIGPGDHDDDDIVD